MNSRPPIDAIYVWIWLPGKTDPVVAGRLHRSGNSLLFNYGRSYLARDDAISIYGPVLPLKTGVLPLSPSELMPGPIRDASPDTWGRRVIQNHLLSSGVSLDSDLDELHYLVESGSDRIGALDFQRSPQIYEPRSPSSHSLEELCEAATRTEKGLQIPSALCHALSSAGGARPKGVIEIDAKKFLAKFAAKTDLHDVVKAEFVGMRLAKAVGLHVVSVSIVPLRGKSTLLVERFDRAKDGSGWPRAPMVSALTVLGLNEKTPHLASYVTFAEVIRHRFASASTTLRELFARLTFNVLISNTDDHARNHAAFWDGEWLRLTPGYDICPQRRSAGHTSQAMLIDGQSGKSRLSTCVDVAHHFLLTEAEALKIIEQQIDAIGDEWSTVCDLADLAPSERRLLWKHSVMNASVFEGLRGARSALKKRADEARGDPA